jgi:hypothetical protein
MLRAAHLGETRSAGVMKGGVPGSTERVEVTDMGGVRGRERKQHELFSLLSPEKRVR